MSKKKAAEYIKIHVCDEWYEYNGKEFHMRTEIQPKSLTIFETFTESTPQEYLKKHPNSYELHINFCPWCGKKL